MIIETERLILREWKKSDVDSMATINQDPKVMEFFPSTRSYAETEKFIDGNIRAYEKYGYCLYAVELKEGHKFIGFVGLNYTDFAAHFTPAVEIGWRLGSQFWGKGYATEGAKAALDYGFKKCGLKEIVSFTVPTNVRSIRVMEKMGLKLDGNFAHPQLPADHPLSQHVLYCLTKADYLHKVQETI